MSYRKRSLILAATLCIPMGAHASWLSEITGIDIDLNRGSIDIRPPNVEAIVPMIQNLPKDVGQAMLNPAAPALATAIRFSRGQALNRGTQPVPHHVRSALSPYFPPHILEKAKWTTADGVSIDGLLSNWLNQEGAVTLNEIVAFSSSNLASDIGLWAHELTHVLQYDQMGVETFAFQYTVDWGGLEQQARDNANRIMSSLNSTSQGASASWKMDYSSQADSSLSWSEINSAAMQAINPVTCIWINNSSNMTGNMCPIPVRVTGIVLRRFADGAVFQYPCNEPTCQFMPNQSGPLLSPFGHQVVGVTAAYEGF